MMRPGAERQVKTELLLDAVAKAEGIEATDEDKDEFYKQPRRGLRRRGREYQEDD